eukprot:COSAG06_NODE_2411_length_6920_cov_64.918634_4_plen_661_part_00
MPEQVPHCWVCLEEGQRIGAHGLPEGGEPTHTGCACRGSAAGFAHIACLIEAVSAQADETQWDTCPTCKQLWGDPTMLSLARARLDLLADREPGDPHRLAVAVELVEALRVAGQKEEALRRGTEEHVATKVLLGAEHPLTLNATSTLARVHFDMGNYDAALPLQTDVLAIHRRLHGSADEDTLSAVMTLAVTLHRMGKPVEALPLAKEAVDGNRKTLGEDHMRTLSAMEELANIYGTLHRVDRARPILERTLATRRRVLGAQHESTLSSMTALGSIQIAEGEFAGAHVTLKEAVERLTRVCGPEHRRTLFARQNMVVAAGLLADPVLAAKRRRHFRKLQLDARAVSARVVGLASRPELNGAMVRVVRFISGKARYTVLTQSGSSAKGEGPSFLTSPSGLLYAQSVSSAEEEGRSKQEKVNLKPTNLIFAAGSDIIVVGLTGAPELNSRRGEVESWEEEQGRYVVRIEGETRLKKLKPVNCQADVPCSEVRDAPEPEPEPEPEHPVMDLDGANAALGTAITQLQRGNPAEALSPAKLAVEAFLQLLGDEDRTTLHAMELLAQICIHMDMHDLARPFVVQVFDTRSRLLGPRHQDTLNALASLGALLVNEGDHVAAAERLKEAVDGLTEVCGAEHPMTSQARANMQRNAECLAKLQQQGQQG